MQTYLGWRHFPLPTHVAALLLLFNCRLCFLTYICNCPLFPAVAIPLSCRQHTCLHRSPVVTLQQESSSSSSHNNSSSSRGWSLSGYGDLAAAAAVAPPDNTKTSNKGSSSSSSKSPSRQQVEAAVRYVKTQPCALLHTCYLSCVCLGVRLGQLPCAVSLFAEFHSTL